VRPERRRDNYVDHRRPLHPPDHNHDHGSYRYQFSLY
jgi:hypothetical protein